MDRMFLRPLIATVLAMGGTATGDLIENHNISLGTVCSVGAIVMTGAWSLSKRFTLIDDRISSLEKLTRDFRCARCGYPGLENRVKVEQPVIDE